MYIFLKMIQTWQGRTTPWNRISHKKCHLLILIKKLIKNGRIAFNAGTVAYNGKILYASENIKKL